jgi:hypothetical protein
MNELTGASGTITPAGDTGTPATDAGPPAGQEASARRESTGNSGDYSVTVQDKHGGDPAQSRAAGHRDVEAFLATEDRLLVPGTGRGVAAGADGDMDGAAREGTDGTGMGHPGTGTDAPRRTSEGEGTPGGPSVSRTFATASEAPAVTRPESAGSADNPSGSVPPEGTAEDSDVNALVTKEEVLLGTSVRTDSEAGIGGGQGNRQGVDEAISDPAREKDGPGSVGTAGRTDPAGESGNGRTADDNKDAQDTAPGASAEGTGLGQSGTGRDAPQHIGGGGDSPSAGQANDSQEGPGNEMVGPRAAGKADLDSATPDTAPESATLGAEVANLKADSAVLRNENAELRGKVAELEAGNATRDERGAELQARLTDLEAKDTRRDAETDALRAQLARVAAMADDMRKELDAGKDTTLAAALGAGALPDRSGQPKSVKGEKAHEQQRSGRFSNEVISYAVAATGAAATVAGDALGTEVATAGGIITVVAGLGAAHIAWRRSRREKKEDHGDQA